MHRDDGGACPGGAGREDPEHFQMLPTTLWSKQEEMPGEPKRKSQGDAGDLLEDRGSSKKMVNVSREQKEKKSLSFSGKERLHLQGLTQNMTIDERRRCNSCFVASRIKHPH